MVEVDIDEHPNDRVSGADFAVSNCYRNWKVCNLL